MDKIKAGLWALAIAFFVIGVPIIINVCYQRDTVLIMTQWDADDILSYYGAVLAAAGAAIGVYLSVKKAQENYRDDIRRQALPFIYVTPLSRKARVNHVALLGEDNVSTEAVSTGGQAIEYEEYKHKQFYFAITSSGIEPTKKLNKYQQKILENGGITKSVLKNGMKVPDYIDHFNLPLEIENVGRGAAVNLKIGFIAIQEINKEYQRRKTNQHNLMEGLARMPEQSPVEAVGKT